MTSYCLRGHDISVLGRTKNRQCLVCRRQQNRDWMRKYRLNLAPERKRYELIYNRTVRYSKRTDRIIERQENRLASYY